MKHLRFGTRPMLLALLAGLGSAALAYSRPVPANPSDELTLIELEHEWADAQDRGDIKTLGRIVADFMDTSAQGTTWTMGKDTPKAPPPGWKPGVGRQHLDDLKVRILGEVGIVTGRDVATDRGGKVLSRIRFTDTLAKRADQWRAIAAQERPIIEPEGKPVQHEPL